MTGEDDDLDLFATGGGYESGGGLVEGVLGGDEVLDADLASLNDLGSRGVVLG